MCCSKCLKNKQSYILFWTCLMFLSILSAGFCFCIIVPDPYQYGESYTYDSQYMTVGVNMCIIGFFGFVITFCVACMLHNQSVGYQQIAQDTERQPIPSFVQVPQVLQYENAQYQGSYLK
ncbi:Hypothetical_protein [Hexamita inflata]|uniref:Hypothetical_protein n=1 Tax=Hexamita inflata TaxID=28002 RepID=A0AA86UE47_9EUKA|nr:Hypothetical protein HINF_LOCUS42210 [Hexamita inflata]